MSEWVELETWMAPGGSVGPDRLYRPNKVIANCGKCGIRQPYGVSIAAKKSDGPIFSAVAKCIDCNETARFVAVYPSDGPETGHIHPDRLFQLINCTAVGQEIGLQDQERKMRERFAAGDYDGSISACCTFIEKFLKIELIRLDGTAFFENQGDLRKLYAKFMRVSGKDPADPKNSALKPLLSALIGLVAGVYEVANKLGDRHDAKAEIGRAEAKLALDSTINLCNFLRANKR